MTNQPVDTKVKQTSVSGLVCVTLEVHLWSGRKRLKKEALIAKNPEFANLPPESLASLGTIKICDTDDLSPFLKLKREAEKLLDSHGLPVLGTRGIPENKLDDVYVKLAMIKHEFDAKAHAFKHRFESAIELWRAQPENAEWTNLISDIPTPEHVAGRLSFGFHLCRVGAPSSDEFSDANALYAKQMVGLKGELFNDAAKEATNLITKYLTGTDNFGVVKKREKVTWKTLRPLRRIGEKFKSFSFLDPTVEPLSKMIEHVLQLLPADGPIDGLHLMHVWTVSQTLANPHQAMQIASVAFESVHPADAFEHLLELNSHPQSPFSDPVAIPVAAKPEEVVIDVKAIEPTKSGPQEDVYDVLPMATPEPAQTQYVGLF